MPHNPIWPARENKSDLEDEFDHWWQLLAPNGVPLPHHKEYQFEPTRKWLADRAWTPHLAILTTCPFKGVLVEIDGGQFKKFGGKHNTDQDREKTNWASMQGWIVLRFSTTMIQNDPQKMVNTICLALQKIGWTSKRQV